ncbi:hypothetical protein [Microcystis aeruginosa]
MNWLMNNRLCLHLMANKEKGFALPLAVLIGLILMVTGMTMMMRAQGDQSKVIAQKARADSLTSSEVGLARVQDLLNSVRVMARFNSNTNCGTDGCWQNAEVVPNPSNNLQEHLKKLHIATACSNPDNPKAANTLSNKIEELRVLSQGNWFELGNNLYYRVVGYNFDVNNPPQEGGLGWGVLTLEGRSRKSAAKDPTKTLPDIDSDDNAASRNRVVVTIPIRLSLPLAFTRTTVPALWVSEGAMVIGEDSADFQGDVVNLECRINGNDIKQPKSAFNSPYKAQFIDNTVVSFPDLPKPLVGIPSLGDLTSSETFPRRDNAGNITDPHFTRIIDNKSVDVYEYTVDNINLSSGQITIEPGYRVVFYVRGNIKGAIKHDCGSVTDDCKSGNLQIYADNELGYANPQICLEVPQKLGAFIFAPAYSLGKTGKGDFVGAAWGKNWGKIPGCVSDDNAVAVTQGVEWTELIDDLKPDASALETAARDLPQLDKIANWCEEPIDTEPAVSKCVP